MLADETARRRKMGRDEQDFKKGQGAATRSPDSFFRPTEVVERERNQREKHRGQTVSEQDRYAERFDFAEAPGMTIERNGDAAESGHGGAKLCDGGEYLRSVHQLDSLNIQLGSCRCSAMRFSSAVPTNVLGTELQCCCRDPLTGFFRDGYCRTGPEDVGLHTVCVKVTREFLDFSVLDGNDLVTPHPEWGFPGLEPGDKWCVCVTRWKDALEHDVAAPVVLEATHSSALEFVSLEQLQAHALKES